MAYKNSGLDKLESVLAWAFVASVLVSVLSILAILLAAFGNNVWIPTGLGLMPMLALPFGILCLAGVFILNAKRKKNQKP